MQRNLSNYYKKFTYNKKPAGVVTNPAFLISKQIYNIGERLIDFLPKFSEHLSLDGYKKVDDPTERLFSYSITDDNKIYSISLLIHDKLPEEKSRYSSYIRETLGCSWVKTGKNILTFGWNNGTTSILKIAEIIIYLGQPEMYVIEKKDN